MPALTTDSIIQSRVSVLIGTAGETPTTVWGHIPEDASVEFTAEREEGDFRAIGRDLPLRRWHYYKGLQVTVPTIQVCVDNVALVAGLTKSGTEISFGDPSVSLLKPQLSVSFTGYNLAGSYVRITLLYASMSGNVVLNQEKTKATVLNAVFTAEDGDTLPKIDFDGGT